MLINSLLQMIFGTEYYQPGTGRIAIRSIDERHCAIVGIVHLPHEFQIQEGAAYLGSFLNGQCAFGPRLLDSGIPEYLSGQGISVLLCERCWYPTPIQGTAAVRFLQAFPESNGWIVFGVSEQPLVKHEQLSNTGHAWFDIHNGTLKQIDAPAPDSGFTCGQLLTMQTVWPDVNGTLYSLPEMESAWREVYYQLSLLHAELGAGNISKSEFFERVNADQRLERIASRQIDMEFCKYLAHLNALGGLHIQRPLTAADQEKREELAGKALEMALGLTD